MAWTVLFFRTASDKCPVAKFLTRLPDKARKKCLGYIEFLEERGLDLPSSYLEKVRGQLLALRPEFGGNEYRLFFFKAGRDVFVMTHAILKNTPRIPPNDIETAENRMQDWLERNPTEKK